jgi:polar amino acid transport system permease protein
LERFARQFLDAEVFWRFLPNLASGLLVTVALAAAVVASGLCIGLLLAVLRVRSGGAGRVALHVYVDLFRIAPPLVVMSLLFFGLPLVGVRLGSFVSAWLALALALSAFAEEIFWTAILSVDRGQWLAGRALGLGFGRTFFLVVLPQAMRLAVPPLTNRTVAITKGTALASVVGVPEMLGEAIAATSYASNTTPLVMAAAGYLLLFWPLTFASKRLERHAAVGLS